MSIASDFDDRDKHFDKNQSAAEKRLLRNYKRALDDTRKDLAAIYAKYEKDGILTMAEMSKANRLQTMYRDIGKQLGKNAEVCANEIKNLAGKSFSDSYYWTTYAIEKNAKRLVEGFGMLDQSVINAAVNAKIGKLKLSQRLNIRRAEVIGRIREEITLGLTRGESYGKMAGRIKSVLEGDAGKAITTARTEAHRCQVQGFVDSIGAANEGGIKTNKVWDSTLDIKTREDHRDMDGQKVKADEDFVLPDGSKAAGPGLSGIAEQDINCRCRVRIEFVGFEAQERRVRGEGIVEYKTYREWEKGRLAA